MALARPRMVAVGSLLILILGVLTVMRTPTDVFPTINVPVVNVIWSYGGLAPEEMAQRVTNMSERSLMTTVDNLDHVESQSLPGVCLIKVYLRPGTNIGVAIAQITSISATIVRAMPQGSTPPIILQSNASNVPVMQLAMTSPTLTAAQINDLAGQTVRPFLTVIPGIQVSPPFGGVPRVVQVDLIPKQLYAKGISPVDVTTALSAQNLILPAGTAKMGGREYFVRLNNSFTNVDALNDVPIKMVNGAIVYVRDVAQVRDGYGNQINEVNANGHPAVLLTIFKTSSASTLEVVNRVRAALPAIEDTLPPGVQLSILQDQSIFVRAAVLDVVQEGVIAACLTGLMILLFLGSWRSTLIVFFSIPLAIFSSILIMGIFGETLNTLTLGGLALAVGILVDDATVEIENTTRILALDNGRSLKSAILESAHEVALPTLASTLSICIVFVPVAFLTGVAQSLFLPLAVAVIFAMLPSYLLSRTLVTTLMNLLIGPEMPLHRPNNAEYREVAPKMMRGILWRIHEAIEHALERVRESHLVALEWALEHRKAVLAIFVLFVAVSGLLVGSIGADFFPTVDSGAFRLHVRAPAGTRLEETTQIFSQIEATIREVVPPSEVKLILDNIGTPGALNLAFSTSGTIGSADGEINVSLAERHHPTAGYVRRLRTLLAKRFPNETFFFAPADIETQILNFGISAPVDVMVMGPFANQQKNYEIAQSIARDAKSVPGAVDVYIQQVVANPEIRLDIDRTRAEQVGLTQQNVASSVLVSLSSSSLTAPTYYVDPKNGVQYTVSAQTPQRDINSLPTLLSTPVTGPNAVAPQLLYNLATVHRDTTPAVFNHYNLMPSFDVYISADRRDLGGVAGDVDKIVARYQKRLPRGSRIQILGQATTMQSSFVGLGGGLVFAILLVYLLLTVNFESFIDPVVILAASPSALCGIVWTLFATGTTFNVPSLMGSIMCIGVATANSILLVTFANDLRKAGRNAHEAALEAGQTRLRPVLMTALAMIIGMLPMSLALGVGGEQNAPLGRAVIGGLIVATFSTLLFVPVVYSVLRVKSPVPEPEEDAEDDMDPHQYDIGSAPPLVHLDEHGHLITHNGPQPAANGTATSNGHAAGDAAAPKRKDTVDG
jgi:multidrug efflux pump subunit AcrB